MHTRWIFIFLRGIELLYSRFFSRFQIPEWNEIHIIAWIPFPKIRYYPYRISTTFPQSIKFSKRFERSARGKKTLHIGRTQETTWAEIKWTSPRSFDEWKVCQVLFLSSHVCSVPWQFDRGRSVRNDGPSRRLRVPSLPGCILSAGWVPLVNRKLARDRLPGEI